MTKKDIISEIEISKILKNLSMISDIVKNIKIENRPKFVIEVKIDEEIINLYSGLFNFKGNRVFEFFPEHKMDFRGFI